jgi:arabinogalactan endo-1,4-beta-galactosidase
LQLKTKPARECEGKPQHRPLRRLVWSAWLCAAAALCLVCAAAADPPGGTDAPPSAIEFIKGADVSSLQEVENHGGVFRENGSKRDLLDILKHHGFNYARLRIWNNSEAGYCGLDSTLVMAARVNAKGLRLLLDFHYSDTWADPGKQTKPASWVGLDFDALKDSMYAYTHRVIARLKAQNTLPDMVQIGNEMTCGMLWDDGRVCGAFDTQRQWENLAELISEGIRAVHDASGDSDSVRIVIHIDRGGDTGGSEWFFDHLLAHGVDFDVIGLSYYPWWHGTLAELGANLDTLALRYGRDIIVAETAYPWTLAWHDNVDNIVGLPGQLLPGYPASPDGQERFLEDLIGLVARTPEGRGLGIFYWEPGYISSPGMGSPWENMTLFDFKGNVLPSIYAFQEAP